MKNALSAAAAILAATLAACGRAPAPEPVTVRDSAGITIVENTVPEWSGDAGWRVSDASLLSIGGSDDRPGHDLYDVAGAVLLSDGGIAIASSGTHDVRIFDAAGTLVRTLGGSGEGPGEFRSIGRIWRLPGDSLLLSDPHLDRLTVFAPDGKLLRTAVLAAAAGHGIPIPSIMLGNGALLARPGFSFGTGTTAGIYRDTLPLYRYGTDGRLEMALGRFPMSEHFVYNEGGSSLAGERIWGRVTRLASLAGGFVVGYSDDWSYEVRGPDGALLKVVRTRRPLTPVQPTDVEQLEAAAADGDPSSDALWRRVLAATDFPSHFPAYEHLATDAAGNVWLQEYRWPQPATPRPWQVLSSDGRWLGAVSLPATFRPLHIGDDRILGVERDELDVEQVRVYALRRTTR